MARRLEAALVPCSGVPIQGMQSTSGIPQTMNVGADIVQMAFNPVYACEAIKHTQTPDYRHSLQSTALA